MNMPIKQRLRALFLTLMAFGLGHALAAVNDHIVLKLKDGRQVEGKVIVEDLAKFVVEYPLRGITRQEAIYRHNVVGFHVLSPEELAQRARMTAPQVPAASPVPVPPSAATVQPVAPAPSAAPGPPMQAPAEAGQQARQLLAQGRFLEAAQLLEQKIGVVTDAGATAEPRQLLKEVCATWLESLEKAKMQVENQLASASNRVAEVEARLVANQRSLEDRRRQEGQVTVVNSKTYNYGDSDYSGSRAYSSPSRLQKGTGDPGAQAAINSLEIQVMTDKQELSRRAVDLPPLRQQLAALEKQIASIETRWPEFTAKLKILLALLGSQDVTSFLQNKIKDGSLTVTAVPEDFGLAREIFESGKLFIKYSLGKEEKTVTVESGWTLELPSMKLMEPKRSWYEKNWYWLLGGVLALWMLSRCFRPAY